MDSIKRTMTKFSNFGSKGAVMHNVRQPICSKCMYRHSTPSNHVELPSKQNCNQRGFISVCKTVIICVCVCVYLQSDDCVYFCVCGTCLPPSLFSIRLCAVKLCCIAWNHSISLREQSVCLQRGDGHHSSPRSQFTLIETPLKHKPGQYSSSHNTVICSISVSPQKQNQTDSPWPGDLLCDQHTQANTHTHTDKNPLCLAPK